MGVVEEQAQLEASAQADESTEALVGVHGLSGEPAHSAGAERVALGPAVDDRAELDHPVRGSPWGPTPDDPALHPILGGLGDTDLERVQVRVVGLVGVELLSGVRSGPPDRRPLAGTDLDGLVLETEHAVNARHQAPMNSAEM